jgi:hypothetical protein
MQLHWGKEHLFKVLPESLRSRFDEALVDPHFKKDLPFPHINGETGEVLAEIHMPGLVRVSRGKLRKLLSGGEQITIQVSMSFPGCLTHLLCYSYSRLLYI